MVRLILLLLFVALILAIRYLPWWALLGGPVLLVLMAWLLRGRIFMWLLGKLFLLPFKAKGRVLRQATVEVHSLRPVAAPPLPRLPASDTFSANGPAEDDDNAQEATPASSAPRDYYELEATITPRPATGAFKLWEPGEVRLVQPGKKWDDDDDCCEVVNVAIDQDGIFTEDEGMKYPGPQRLRLLIAVRPGTPKLAFAYYLEQFGEVTMALAGPT